MMNELDVKVLFDGVQEGDALNVNGQNYHFVRLNGEYVIVKKPETDETEVFLCDRATIRLDTQRAVEAAMAKTYEGEPRNQAMIRAEIERQISNSPWFQTSDMLRRAQYLYSSRKLYYEGLLKDRISSQEDFEAGLDRLPPDVYQDLTYKMQNILYNLEPYTGFNGQILGFLLHRLEKATLAPMIEAQIGHRPRSFVVDVPRNKNISEDLVAQIDSKLQEGAVYIKKDKGYQGTEVGRIKKGEKDVINCQWHHGNYTYKNLKEFLLNLQDGKYLLEAEIPIAPLPAGRTWEVRFIPPFPYENSYVKLGQKGSHINNIAQGGERASSHKVVQDVIRFKFPHLGTDKIEQHADDFLRRSQEIAVKVKALVDEYEMTLASIFIQPEDLRNPQCRDEIIELFRGNFVCVDITGIWQGDDLVPMIIEAQPTCHLSSEASGEIYKKCRRHILKGLQTLQEELII